MPDLFLVLGQSQDPEEMAEGFDDENVSDDSKSSDDDKRHD